MHKNADLLVLETPSLLLIKMETPNLDFRVCCVFQRQRPVGNSKTLILLAIRKSVSGGGRGCPFLPFISIVII